MTKTPDEINTGLSLYTPEEIKAILRQEWTIHSHEKLYRSALAYIQQLESQNASLQSLMVSANAEIADLDTEVEELHARIPRWISVEERLPERGTWVLCCGAKGGLFLSDWLMPFNDGTVYCSVPNARTGRYAKYWMPIAEPPKEEEKC